MNFHLSGTLQGLGSVLGRFVSLKEPGNFLVLPCLSPGGPSQISSPHTPGAMEALTGEKLPTAEQLLLLGTQCSLCARECVPVRMGERVPCEHLSLPVCCGMSPRSFVNVCP